MTAPGLLRLLLLLAFIPLVHGGQAPLEPKAHPRAYIDPTGLAQARAHAKAQPWAIAHLETQRQLTAPLVAMDPARLAAIVPAEKSHFIVGTGLVTDPASGKTLQWGGWDHPHTLINDKGERFPNDTYPDDGTGHRANRRLYPFAAAAHSETTRRLEESLLPALAEVYALTGSTPHAATAAHLLDALAATSAQSGDALLDIPRDPPSKAGYGRLHRPGVQTGRALENYVYTIDLIAPSGELRHPSRFAQGKTIAQHLSDHLLLDTARYALHAATTDPAPGNGRIEARRGAAAVGLLLNRQELIEPLLTQPGNLYEHVEAMIDRNGFFLENAMSYEQSGLDLFRQSADLLEAIRRHWPEMGASLYDLPKIAQLFRQPLERRQVGGHFPATGQSPSDLDRLDPQRRVPRAAFRNRQEEMQALQLALTWRRLRHAPHDIEREAAADDLARSFADREGEPAPLADRWSLYHVTDPMLALAAGRTPATPPIASTFYGSKGLALLRSRGPKAKGAQLFFGPHRLRNQREALTWLFYADGVEWSFDPGRHQGQFRAGWADQSVAHQSLLVDARSMPHGNGGGSLLAFLDERNIQWALAQEDHAFPQPALRWIAQRPRYWLDIGYISGGRSRDDSFHAAMRELDSPELHSWYMDSTSGDRHLGNAIRPDYRIEGFKGGFHDEPPGFGYSFLGAPRSLRLERPIALTLRNPIFPKMENVRLHLWLDGSPSRNLIVSDGPTAPRHPSLPYLIRRDDGPGQSWFGKVIALGGETSPIARFERLPVLKGEGMAWRVTLADKSSDLWFIRRGSSPLTIRWTEGTTLETDAACALLSLDAEGHPSALHLSQGNYFHGAGLKLTFQAHLSGTIAEVHRPSAGGLRLKSSPLSTKNVPEGTLLRTLPATGANGTPGVWRFQRSENDTLFLEDLDDTLGQTHLTAEKGGWFAYDRIPAGLLLTQGRWNIQAALGKPVYAGERWIGRISEIVGNRLRLTGIKGEPPTSFTATIRELEPGQRIEFPLNGHWLKPR